uniref:Uncharacterized protein n=1 Tax=Hyaloperonospora arabidopsidis (strain Emoy2) TaxID=559515 RepID=M4B543_HYAAE
METNTGKADLGYARRTTIFTGRVVDCIRSPVEHRAVFRRTGLRERVCGLSWIADRPSCFMQWRKWCHHCERHGIPRPDRAQWTNILRDCPLSEEERTWIGRYERAFNDHQRAHGWTQRTWTCVDTLQQPQELARQRQSFQHRDLPGVLDWRVLQYRELLDARDPAHLPVVVVHDIRNVREKCCARLP